MNTSVEVLEAVEELEEELLDGNTAEPSGEESGYFSSWRPNRALRRFMKRREKKNKTSPIRQSAIRVVFRPDGDLSLEEELLVLGALEELKKQHNQLKIVYCTGSSQVFSILKNRWFVQEVYLVPGDDMISRAIYSKIVKDDVDITISRPDPEVVKEAEQKEYDKWFEAEVAEKNQQQQAALDKGIKDFKAVMPTYSFFSLWGKSNAFLWSMADEMGLPVKIPSTNISPFGSVSSEVRRNRYKLLHKSHILDKPFVVCEFGENDNELVLLSAMDPLFPECQVLSKSYIDKITGGDLGALMTVLGHQNCQYVVSTKGLLITTAWGVGIQYMLELYEGDNSRWDGCLAPNCLSIPWSQLSEEDKPKNLIGSIMYHLQGG